MTGQNNIWLLSETYYPDEVGTAYYTTKLAEGLTLKYRDSVKVLCGYPIYNARGMSVPTHEIFNGVNIKRCCSTTFNKDSFSLRIINLISVSISIFLHALFEFKKQDIVLVVTSPPSLPLVIAIACFLKRAKCIFRTDDVYPEGIVATGYARPASLLIRIFMYISRFMHRKAEKVVVVGRDMANLVARNKLNGCYSKIQIIPNWADIGFVLPLPKERNKLLQELNLERKFVVQCAGNMGQAQNIESIFGAAEILISKEEIHFLFIGSGAKRKWMENEKINKNLNNITIVEQRPRSEQPVFLNACDISAVSLLKGLTGIGVPSRMYNIMAAGKAIIAIAAEDSELSLVVKEEGIGWVVEPDAPGKLSEVILEAHENLDKTKQMGNRARKVAESKYSRATILNKYCELIESLGGIAD
jgi:glycosyltransferase involved in cell wall biosynthesis